MSSINEFQLNGDDFPIKKIKAIGGASISVQRNEFEGFGYKGKSMLGPNRELKYENISYAWSNDYSSCTGAAEMMPGREKVTEIGQVSVETQEATHYEDGYKTYTATFSGKAFKTQVKQETIPCPGHNFNDPVYTWSSDGKTCTAKRTCKDDEYYEEEIGTMSYSEIEPTYTEEGSKIATATFINTAFETQENVYEIIPIIIPPASFSTGTDEEICAVLDKYYSGELTLEEIKSVWKVGDSRKIHINAMSATGVSEAHHADDYEFVILDFNHDTLTTAVNGITKALVSLQMKRVMYTDTTSQEWTAMDAAHEFGYINSSDTTAGGWDKCARRTWCNNVFFAALPSWVQNYCKQVNKLTSAGSASSTIVTSADKCWLPSEIEIFGSTLCAASGEGSQYSYFTTSSNRNKLPVPYNSGYPTCMWWERSPVIVNGSLTNFCVVYERGMSGVIMSYTRGISPAFCL